MTQLRRILLRATPSKYESLPSLITSERFGASREPYFVATAAIKCGVVR